MRKRERREPKSGLASIWLQPERTPRGAQSALNRAQIVRAAIAIADAEGIDAVTMRRVAADLGVGTMSLYWHVPNKDNLFELMRDELMSEVEMPDPPSGDWRADLRTIAYQTRATMKRHPWMLAIFASMPGLGPNMLRHVDLSLAAVDGLGLDLQTMFTVISLVDDYTLGFTLGEVNQDVARRDIGLTPEELRAQWFAAMEPFARQAIATGRYPRLAQVEHDPFDFLDSDRIFEFGLACVLDGIAVRIEAVRNRSEGP